MEMNGVKWRANCFGGYLKKNINPCVLHGI